MADSIHIEITDNSGLVKEEFQAACLLALEKCGLTAEGYAKLVQFWPMNTMGTSCTILLNMSQEIGAMNLGRVILPQ